jgi:pimeloyl-ACP methyl ester carboxylesterase
LPGLKTIAWVVVIAIAVAAVSVVLLIFRKPLAVFAWMERRSLARQGLKKSILNARTGKITFWEGGSGPILVFLHGAGDQAGAWSQVLPELGAGHRVLLPDLPGHGDSEPARGPLTVGMELSGLEALLSARAPQEQVVLIGNSLGAWVAMLYAYRHPEQVLRVVAVNGGAIRGERHDVSLTPANREEAHRLMRLLRDPGSPVVPGFVLDDVVREARNGPIGRLSQSAADMEQYLLDDHLKEFKVPVDIVWGQADQFMGTAYAKRLEEGLPAARLTMLPRCGHVPQRECPAAFASKVAELLKMPPPQAASTSLEPTTGLH